MTPNSPAVAAQHLPWTPRQVVPARLAFLAIYNPSLGLSEETFADQLVFYYSRTAQEARAKAKKAARGQRTSGNEGPVFVSSDGDQPPRSDAEEVNERLRQIGLAQGMVNFASTFSEGRAVESIDTEKSRIVLTELENGWWVLASIDLTRVPVTPSQRGPTKAATNKPDSASPTFDYSSREVSSSLLLIQQLRRAHSIFTLHHGPSLTELFVRMSRHGFCQILERFWTHFLRTWDILLHANPAADVFSGIKLASGGELGIGVGEEEWGSGEREVLEDLTRRTEGLVDLAVSRFGDDAEQGPQSGREDESVPWLGAGNYPLASDGVVFGGVGNITRASLRSVTSWSQQVYRFGEYAYGVRDNPGRHPRKPYRRRNPFSSHAGPTDSQPKRSESTQAAEAGPRDSASRTRPAKPLKRNTSNSVNTAYTSADASASELETPTENRHVAKIPPPIFTAAANSLERATQNVDSGGTEQPAQPNPSASGSTMLGIPDQYMKYLTLGLSTLAKPNPQSTTEKPQLESKVERPVAIEDQQEQSLRAVDPTPDGELLQAKVTLQRQLEEQGHFIIGLKGDLEQIPEDQGADGKDDDEDNGRRKVLRKLYIEVVSRSTAKHEKDESSLQEMLIESESQITHTFQRLQVLVYVHRPFIYCFLFKDRTPSLSMAQFFTDLHRNLLPIHKPLLASTSSDRIFHRLKALQAHTSPDTDKTDPNPVYDLIYDPVSLTVHTSIPNIPEPGTPAAEGIVAGDSRRPGSTSATSLWTRVEALNVHTQILNTLASVDRSPNEYERTCKTIRGWWLVWMRFPPSDQPSSDEHEQKPEMLAPTKSPADPNSPPSPNEAAESPTPLSSPHSNDKSSSIPAKHHHSVQPCFQPSAPSHKFSSSTIASTQHPSPLLADLNHRHRTVFLVRKAEPPSSKPHRSSLLASPPSSPASAHLQQHQQLQKHQQQPLSPSHRSTSSTSSAAGMWASLALRPPTLAAMGIPGFTVSPANGSGTAEPSTSDAHAAETAKPGLQELVLTGDAVAVAHGIGFDVHAYVDGLLSLNR